MHFTSCEDDLVTKPFGVRNVACSATSLIIMAVPLLFLQRSLQYLHSPITPTSSKNTSTTAISALEPILYSLTLTVTFFFNLLGHLNGYTGPPSLDCAGYVSNAMLSAMLYRTWWTRTIKKKKKGSSPPSRSLPSPNIVTFGMSCMSLTLFILPGLLHKESWETIGCNTFGSITTVYVVCTMGRLSWNDHNKDGGDQDDSLEKVRLEKTSSSSKFKLASASASQSKSSWSCWKLWLAACTMFVLVTFLTEIESSLCHLGHTFSRMYHSTFLHPIIALFFWFVAECAFRLFDLEEHGELVVVAKES